MTAIVQLRFAQQIIVFFRRWWVATILAIGWHALWWNWLRVEPARSRPLAASAALVRYAPVPAQKPMGIQGRDVISPMSPLLFALPTRQGFSGPTWQTGIRTRPPLAPPMASQPLFDLSAALGGSAPSLWPDETEWKKDVEVALQTFSMKLDQDPVYVLSPVTGEQVRIECSGVLDGVQLKVDDLPVLPPELSTQAWEMAVFLEIGERGVVRRLLIEQRSPSEIFNEQLDRRLRGRIFREVQRPGEGRLRIRAPGLPPGGPFSERARP